MLKSSLCEYSDAYILEKGIIKITGKGIMPEQYKQTKEINENKH